LWTLICILQCVLISYDQSVIQKFYWIGRSSSSSLFRKLRNSFCIHELLPLKPSCTQPLNNAFSPYSPWFVLILSSQRRIGLEKVFVLGDIFNLNVYCPSQPFVLLCLAHLFSRTFITLMVLVRNENHYCFIYVIPCFLFRAKCRQS
jgi:hypothetical protein